MKKESIILLIIIILLLIGQIYNLIRIGDFLVSSDPYYHKKLSDFTISEQKNIFKIPNSITETPVNYITILYNHMATLSLITGLSTYKIFQIFGLIILIFLSLFIYITSKRITKSKCLPLILTIFFLSFNYLLTRMTMVLPENFILLFLVVIFFLLYINSRFEIIFIFILSYIYYHSRSVIILFLFLLVYLFFNRNKIIIKKHMYKIILLSIISIILLIPILHELIGSYIYLISSYLGYNEPWAKVTILKSIYKPLTLNDILYNFNPIILIVFINSLFTYFIYRDKKKKFLLIFLIISFFIFILLLTNIVGSQIPPSRFIMYLSIFIPIISIFELEYLKHRKYLFILLSFVIIIFFSINIISVHGWSGINNIDKNAIEFIHKYNNINNNSIIITWGSPYYTFFNNSEWNSPIAIELYKINNSEDMIHSINDKYDTNKSILFVVTAAGYNSLYEENPEFFIYMKPNLIYKNESVYIYQISNANIK